MDTARAASPVWSRGLLAAHDAITASVFLWLWIAPLSLGPDGVAQAMLVMLVEFILIHASAFLGGIAFSTTRSRASRLRSLALVALAYLLFVAAWAWVFRAWWPFLAFGWLLAGKLGVALDRRRPAPERHARMQADWALTTVLYLGGIFATAIAALPRLGLTPAVQARLELPGSGLWVDEPHRVIAFGALYFGLLAWAKWRGWRLPAGNRPGATG